MFYCQKCKKAYLGSPVVEKGEAGLVQGQAYCNADIKDYCEEYGEIVAGYVSLVELEPCPNCGCHPVNSYKQNNFNLESVSVNYNAYQEGDVEGDELHFVYQIKCKRCSEVIPIEDCYRLTSGRRSLVYGFRVYEFPPTKKGGHDILDQFTV